MGKTSRKKEKMRTFSKIGGAILAVILAAISLSAAFNVEIRSFVMFKLAPGYARDAHFIKLAGGEDQIIYLLGTIHGHHLKVKDYSLLHIESLIDYLRPELVLVESRPEELAKDNWGDGPIEMPFAALTARSLGIEVAGMDWWEERVGLGGTSEEREDHMVHNALEHLPGHRSTLILTGFSHLPGFIRRLQAEGYSIAPFTRKEKEALFDISGRKLMFPPGMRYYMQKRIDIDQTKLQEESEPRWKSAIEDAIALRKQLLRIIEDVGERQP